MVTALRYGAAGGVGRLVCVDNAPTTVSLNDDFEKYVQGKCTVKLTLRSIIIVTWRKA